MSTGLARYGIRSPTIVREPARDHEGIMVCAECGHPVGSSKSAHKVHHPDVVDLDLRCATDELIVFGWKCDAHPSYEVVMPAHVDALREGWIGVPIAFADEHVRAVPVPEREIERLVRGEQ